MNFGFINPAILWGLLGASLPIIIHLINRRRARKVYFSATYFVNLSNKKLARSTKLKQILLLILRSLMMAILAILLSRIFHEPEISAKAGEESLLPTTRIIVVDNSMSMLLKHKRKTLFELARKKTKEIVTNFGTQDNISIILAPALDKNHALEPSFDRAKVLDFIEEMKPSLLATDFNSALDKARMYAEQTTLKNTRIYLIGDMTRTGYDTDYTVITNEKPVELSLVDVTQDDTQNTAIIDTKMEPSFFAGKGIWKVRVTAVNYGEKDLSGLPVSLLGDDEHLADGFFDIPANSKVSKDFSVRLTQSGNVKIKANLSKDNLMEDNVHYGVLNISKNINALVINGRPSSTRHLDEVFYLREALNPGGLNNSRISVKVITKDRLGIINLNNFDIVYLCHVPKLRLDNAKRLVDFVKSGKGMFISMGASIDIDNYNEYLGELLPGELRGERAGGDPTLTANVDAVYLSRFDYGHPLFKVFDDQTAKSLYLASVRKYMTFSPDSRRPKRILASYTDKSPAIIETYVGKGKSVLFTSTVSRSWNDIPIQSGFLPLMQEIARITTGNADPNDRKELIVGQRFYADGNSTEVTLTDPDGKKINWLINSDKSNEEKDSEKSKLVSPPLVKSGYYTLAKGDKKSLVALNANPVESDLRRMDKNDIKAIFGEKAMPTGKSLSTLSGAKIEYSSMLIWILLFLFLGEVAVLRWMG